jgi:phosphatidylserine/phosphatidylglycerophosphate/cardiolipin synthase-like enzyme
VQVLADSEQHAKTASSRLSQLATADIAVWLETKYQNAHNKVIVIDAGTSTATVITGSFNLTWTAQHKNAENILIVRNNPSLAERYALNWERHRQDAIPYK